MKIRIECWVCARESVMDDIRRGGDEFCNGFAELGLAMGRGSEEVVGFEGGESTCIAQSATLCTLVQFAA